MPSTELIEQAQARLYARRHDWPAFSKGVVESARRTFGGGHSGSADWLSELWFEFALAKEHILLAEFSHWLVDNREKSSVRLPTLSALVDMASKEPRLQWILEREDLHDIWVAGTEVPVPNKEWRSRHHVFGHVSDAYLEWMNAQPNSIQDRQKAYLAKYGNEVLHAKSLLYYAICAFGEPTREQVRAAALANNPVYDMKRLEMHYPGIGGLKATYEGMDMKNHHLRDELGKFMDGTTLKTEEAVPEHGFEAH